MLFTKGIKFNLLENALRGKRMIKNVLLVIINKPVIVFLSGE